jgi:hypothetical protein
LLAVALSALVAMSAASPDDSCRMLEIREFIDANGHVISNEVVELDNQVGQVSETDAKKMDELLEKIDRKLNISQQSNVLDV